MGVIKSFFIFLISLFMFSPSVQAWDLTSFGGGDVNGVMDSAMNNLGVNKTELKYGIQSFNVSRKKKTPPQVTLTFNPRNPSPGQKITAVATTTYFLNESKNLYFTWFLKTKNCPRTSTPDSIEKKQCDLNKDGRVDIADYKIKATRIIVNNGFDWEDANYSRDNSNDSYKANFGGDDQGGKTSYCYIHDTKGGDEYRIKCAHLFPHAPGEVTGDGSFGIKEEKFWHTDPNSPDTAGTGNVDEANVAGLGIKQFTWNYETGDEVGVVVEGVSIESTQTADASYRTMWAMPKSMCDVSPIIKNFPKKTTNTISQSTNSPSEGETTTVTQTTNQTIQSRAANIASIETVVTTTTTVTNSLTGNVISQSSTSTTPTYSVSNISDDISVNNIKSASDLNNCLYANLVSPTAVGKNGRKINVSLSYSPETPMNDPKVNSNSGDTVIVQASLDDISDTSYLNYFWQVYQSDEANPDSWGKPLLKSALPDSTQTTGLGLDSFEFKLNFPHPKKYFRVKLTVTEPTSGGTSREGHTDIIIPIASVNNRMQVFSANVSKSLQLNMQGTEQCTAGINKVVCSVAKNEIIGIKVDANNLSNYAWSIDGKPFTYQTCFFQGCNLNQETNVAYFPVVKEVGEEFNISLVATNQVSGQKINLIRTFKVADPQIKILSADTKTCKPVLLGHYIDFNGKQWPDYSQINFWALSSSPIKLMALTSGAYIPPTDYNWVVDGNSINQNNVGKYGFKLDKNGVLTLPPKPSNQSYNVGVSVLYTQNNLTKKALNKYWGVSYDQFYEKPIADNINVIMQKIKPKAVAQSSSKKIMATLFSAVPAYIAFILRIILTIFLMLVTASLVFSLSSKIKNE